MEFKQRPMKFLMDFLILKNLDGILISEQNKMLEKKDNRKKIFIAVFALIVLLGAFLRFYNLGKKSFSADEFLGVSVAYGYLQTGEWRRWDFNWEKPYNDKEYFKTIFDFDFWNDGPTTYTRAWLYNWQISQALKFLPVNEEWSYRSISVAWGIASLLLIYLIAYKFSDKKTIGLLSMALLAVSIDGIEFSRKVRMYAMFMPVFLLFAYLVFQVFENKKKRGIAMIDEVKSKFGIDLFYLFGAITMGLISMHLHLLTANMVFVVPIYFLIVGALSYKEKKILANRYFWYFIVPILVGGIFALKWGNIFFAGLKWEDHFSYFQKSFADYANILPAIILMVTGAIYLIAKKRNAGIFITTVYLVILLNAVFLWNRNVGAQYLFFVKPFQIILLAGGIYAVAEFLRENSKKYGSKIFAGTIIFLFLITPNFAYFFQQENTYKQTSHSENPNYRKVFKYVVKKRNKNDVLITRNFRNFYWAGQKMKVYSLGGERSSKNERRLTLSRLQEIMEQNPSGWLVCSDNDENFITKEAQSYIKQHFKKIKSRNIRGSITVWRWGNKKF